MSVTWNGMLIGDPDPGSLLRVTAIPESDPGAVATTGARVQADGVWRTTAYRGALSGPLEGVMTAETVDVCDALRRALIAAASVNVAALTVDDPDGPRTIFVARDTELDIRALNPFAFRWATTVLAPDPVWFRGGQTADGALDGTYAQVYTTTLPNRTGGLAFPIQFPLDFAASGDTGDIVLDLDGPARMEWRIDGPVTNPSVAVANSDGVRTVAWQAVLGGGEYLAVDPYAQRSLLLGQASRTPWRRQWPRLVPGENDIRFRAGMFDAAARLTVVVRPLA